MTNYADSTKVTRKVAKFVEDTTSTDFQADLTDALNNADSKINNKIDETTIPTTTPDVIKTIAYYYAVVELLDLYASAGGVRNEIAIAWEKQATQMLDEYTQDKGNEDSQPSQSYTVSHTSLRRPWYGSRTRGHHRW